MQEVIIYTDGACSGNPGPGGYGIVLKHGTYHKEFSSGFTKTTNNRMELLAVIVALQQLKTSCDVTLYSDSKYVVDAMIKGWVYKWRDKNWKNRKNADLWKMMLQACMQHHMKFIWIKGHMYNEVHNRCDQLAVLASKTDAVHLDEGYLNCYN